VASDGAAQFTELYLSELCFSIPAVSAGDRDPTSQANLKLKPCFIRKSLFEDEIN
jgi:hypothetical protein